MASRERPKDAANKTIRVMVVDDHAVVRSGLSAFLLAYDDLELVGEASTGREAIDKCRLLKPDVVLMDLVMPEMDGATATRHIRDECPGTQVLALTSFPEEKMVEETLRAGAIGYLLKNVTAGELAEAIRKAGIGKPSLSPEATEVLLKAARQGPGLGHDLTAREKEILALLVKGLNNVEIADRLVVSRSTVKFHVSSILSKLGATGRTEAVALALQHDLVETEAE